MGQRRHRDCFHVVGEHEVSTVQRGAAAGELEQRETSAGARADGGARRGAGGSDEVHAVFAHAVRDVDGFDCSLHLDELPAIDDRPQFDVVGLALDPTREDVHLAMATRIPEGSTEQEAVELRLGQWIRALVLDRVLRRDDEERRLEPVRDALDRRLSLLHRFEESSLRLRRSPVDLVREKKVGEDGARAELEVAVALVPDRRPRGVRRHEIGRELDPRELHVEDLCERARRERLGEPGIVLQQHVSVGEEREEDELERLALVHDDGLDLVENSIREDAHLREVHRHIASRVSTTRESSLGVMPRPMRSPGAGLDGRTSSQVSSPRMRLAASKSVSSSTRRRAASRPAVTARSRGTKRYWRSKELATPSAASVSRRARLGGGRRVLSALRERPRSGVSGGYARPSASSATTSAVPQTTSA
jgi:hypothetical protein